MGQNNNKIERPRAVVVGEINYNQVMGFLAAVWWRLQKVIPKNWQLVYKKPIDIVAVTQKYLKLQFCVIPFRSQELQMQNIQPTSGSMGFI